MVNERCVIHNELRAGTSSTLQVQARETRVGRSVRRWEEMSLANSSISKTRADMVKVQGHADHV